MATIAPSGREAALITPKRNALPARGSIEGRGTAVGRSLYMTTMI
jgi:hypothetical protein